MDKQKTKRAAPLVLGRAAAWLARLRNEEHLHILITGVQRFILCAVLARGTVFGGYAPFGLAMAAALMARGAGLSAIGGVVCGLMLLDGGLKSGVYIAAALLVLCVMSVCAGLRIVRTAWFAPVGGGGFRRGVHLRVSAGGRDARPVRRLLPFVAVAAADARGVPGIWRGAVPARGTKTIGGGLRRCWCWWRPCCCRCPT